MIIDKKLLKQRIAQYNLNQDKTAKELKQGLKCEFDHFNNTIESEFGEDGVFCQE